MEDNIRLLGYDNPHWKDSPPYFGRLSLLVNGNPKGYHVLFASALKNRKSGDADELRRVYGWVLSRTSFLEGPFWEFATRCYCVLRGITSLDQFPRCRTDGRVIMQNVYSAAAGFRKRYCDDRCRRNDRSLAERIIRDKTLKYGNAFGPVEKIRRTKLERYGDAEYRNSAKASETRKAFSAGRRAEAEARRRATLEANFGVDSPMRSAELRARHRKSCEDRLGRSFGFDYGKARATNRERLGCDWPMQSGAVRRKSAETMLARYGVDNSARSAALRAKARRGYRYDGRFFDSGAELAYYIWLRDSGADFVYNVSEGIPYEHGGKVRLYFPDFEIRRGGRTELVEVKGAHFFRPDGTMFLPYRGERMSDAEYEEACAVYEAKRRCMAEHGVRLVLDPSDELDGCRRYVEERYGRGFLEGCRLKVNKADEKRCQETEGRAVGPGS